LFTYLRVTEQSGEVTEISMGSGGLCVCAVVALGYAADASLDHRAVWRAIAPERPLEPGAPPIPCESCELVVPGAREGAACPRCAAPLERTRPGSLGA